MNLPTMITQARMHGATVYTTSDSSDTLAVVQVIGLPRMTAWPLPASWATRELGAALGGRP